MLKTLSFSIMTSLSAPYSSLADSYTEQVNIAFEKILDQHLDFLLTYAPTDSTCLICLRLLAEAQERKDINGDVVKTNCVVYKYDPATPQWRYLEANNPSFAVMLQKFDSQKHILVSVIVPQTYTREILNMSTGEVRMYERETKKRVM